MEQFHQSTGGGGVNVAIGAHRNGLKTAVVGMIGDNAFKNLILSDLRASGVSTALCQMEKQFLNISSILLTPEGERSIINFETQHMKLFEDAEEMKMLLHAKHVYLGNLPDVSLSQREDMLHFLKKNNVQTIVNMGVKDCRRPLKQLESFLKPVDMLMIMVERLNIDLLSDLIWLARDRVDDIKREYELITAKKVYWLPE